MLPGKGPRPLALLTTSTRNFHSCRAGNTERQTDAKLARYPLQAAARPWSHDDLRQVLVFSRPDSARNGLLHHEAVQLLHESRKRLGESVVDEGVHLLKIYLSVSREAQDMRFRLRQNSELQYWKYSSTDRMAAERWHMITYFKERMFAVTSTDYAPWIVIESDNKHQARLNAFHYILSQFDYPGKNLSLESIQPQTNGRYLTDMIVDGVLFKDMDPDQVEVLERILMHE